MSGTGETQAINSGALTQPPQCNEKFCNTPDRSNKLCKNGPPNTNAFFLDERYLYTAFVP